ncbi:MAG: GNAT family N-acetyltransferase [Capsulimonadaceae bacterium]
MPIVEQLARYHDRGSFDCGKERLNRYLREVARQVADRNLGVTQVVVPASGASSMIGYFTLVTRTVESDVVPEKRLPQGPIGVVLLGRLAVDRRYQGQRIGQRMLLRAMAETEAASRRVGIYALVLDAIDEDARSWYLGLQFGLKPILSDPTRLYVPISFIRQLNLGDIGPEL